MFMVALGPALGTPVDLCPPWTAQLQSSTWLATQPLSQVSWLSPTRAEFPYGSLSLHQQSPVTLGLSRLEPPWP